MRHQQPDYNMWQKNTSSDSIYTYEIHKICKVCACVGSLLDCYGYVVHCAKCFPSVLLRSLQKIQGFCSLIKGMYVDNLYNKIVCLCMHGYCLLLGQRHN